MATVIDTVVRDGRTIAVYDNGMERDLDRGRIIRPPTSALITKENANEYHRARQQKAKARLRAAIKEAHNGKMTPVKSSAAAFAESGALLYEEIVLNADAYPRDRLEAWKELGKQAEILTDGKDKSDEPGQAAAGFFTAATALLNSMREHIHASTDGAIDGLVTESDISDTNNLRIGDGSDNSPTDESEDE